jgi:hypothetical protein
MVQNQAYRQDLNDKIDVTQVLVTVPENSNRCLNGLQGTTSNNGSNHGGKHNHPIPAYLIAFAVTNYAQYTQTLTAYTRYVPH